MVRWLQALLVSIVLVVLGLGLAGCSSSTPPRDGMMGKDKMGDDKLSKEKMGDDKMKDKMGDDKMKDK
jgi:pentapeptide MXKDX repeat protein